MKKITYILIALLIVGCDNKSKDQEKELAELRQLAELDRQEMENQYAEYALQYDELKKGIQDDSLLQRLNEEQQRAENLAQQLKELKASKSSDVAEIRRLKEELATVRAVLRTYILQVDSLQRLNQALTSERDEARAQVVQANTEISNLNNERASLTEKVAIAAQLDATGIVLTPLKKSGKTASKTKDIVRFAVNFSIAKNVTAQAGNRTVYVRLLKPNQTVINPSGSFTYENRTLECSAHRQVEYTGQATAVQMYIPVNETLQGGKYQLSIFVDGQMIGTSSITMEK